MTSGKDYKFSLVVLSFLGLFFIDDHKNKKYDDKKRKRIFHWELYIKKLSRQGKVRKDNQRLNERKREKILLFTRKKAGGVPMNQESYEMAIIGCGPAGLSAALNAQVRKKKFILLGTNFCAPKMHTSPWIDNYLGEFHLTGKELREKFLRHVQDMGIRVEQKRVDAVYPVEKGYAVQCGSEDISARTVIVAIGIDYAKALKGEEEYVGKGVSYCATCDGPLFRKKTVAMLVYSKDGLDEVKYLSEICQEVLLFPMFQGDLSSLPQNVIVNHAKPVEIGGNGFADRIVTDQGVVLVDGVFLFREVVSPGRLVPGLEALDGAIQVNKNMETNLPGLFAAGDCTGKPFQLAKAVGEGQVAALSAVHYLDTGS